MVPVGTMQARPMNDPNLSLVQEENKGLVRRFFETCINVGQIDAADELLAPHFCYHHSIYSATGGDINSLEEWKQKGPFVTLLAAFPDLHDTLEDVIAEGDRVVVRLTMRATHQAPFWGIAPTGKKIKTTSISIYCIKGKKIVEGWSEGDVLSIFYQLGAKPPVDFS